MQACFVDRLFWLVVAFTMLLVMPVPAQPQPVHTYQVGYQQLQPYDVTRSFDTARVDSLRFRPVPVALFYPSRSATSTAPLPYGHFLNAYGSRMNCSVSADSCRRVGAQLADCLRAGLQLDVRHALSTLPTHSTLAAPMVPAGYNTSAGRLTLAYITDTASGE